MDKKLLSRRTAATLAAAALLGTQIAACTTTSPSAQGSDVMTSTNKHATTNSQADSTLSRLYSTADGSRELVSRAKGVLVFPSVLNAGFVIGGSTAKACCAAAAVRWVTTTSPPLRSASRPAPSRERSSSCS